MPELPEVETVRRQLAPLLTGRAIRRCAIYDPLLAKSPEDMMRQLSGVAVANLSRRGKYLCLELADGRRAVIHLRMTGMLQPIDAEPPHTRMVWQLDDGTLIAFVDARRFGTLDLFADQDALDAYLAPRLGPEPGSPQWSAEALANGLARRASPIKAALLDQRIGCGLGNIYVDEALHRAGVNPHTPANAIDADAVARIADLVPGVLADATRAGGSNVRDYVPPGTTARYQEQHQVYGRGGLPCLTCGATLEKTRIGGRATVHCPTCQPA